MNLDVVRRSVAYLPTSAPFAFNDKLGLLFIQVPISKKSAVSQTRTEIRKVKRLPEISGAITEKVFVCLDCGSSALEHGATLSSVYSITQLEFWPPRMDLPLQRKPLSYLFPAFGCSNPLTKSTAGPLRTDSNRRPLQRCTKVQRPLIQSKWQGCSILPACGRLFESLKRQS